MRTPRRLIVIASVWIAMLAMPLYTFADAPPGPYFNGFETDTAGWSNFSGATITRVPSGTGGVMSATGGYHATLGIDPSPGTCASGGGPQPVYTGPFTNFDGYSSSFPLGGYTTGVDIYLDTIWASAHFDRRFDWSSAINDTAGLHRRDFAFNVATEPTGFVISAGTNANRCGTNPPTGTSPAHVVVPGWYTFEHRFSGLPGSPLVVTMRLINKMTSATVGTWIVSVASDVIGTTVGGNRYGWFVQNEIDGLAIDNSFRTGVVSTPGCEIKINNGGSITAVNGDPATFGGNAKVSMTGATSGQQEFQDHGPVQPLRFKAETVSVVVCSDDRTSAEIYGTGTVNGTGSYDYRITLTDAGEPGTSDRYGIVINGVPPYISGDQTLQGGNVQIR